MNISESNIYMAPKSPKRRQFKTVNYIQDKKVDYQEVNSDGVSVGGILKSLPPESISNSKKSAGSKVTTPE